MNYKNNKTIFHIIILFFLLFFLSSCKTKNDVIIKTNETKNQNNPPYIIKENPLIPNKYDIQIESLQNSEILLDDMGLGISPIKISVTEGVHKITLHKENYEDQDCYIDVKFSTSYIFKHQKQKIPIEEIGIVNCGEEPKQVLFSPDDKFIFIPLLNGDGFEVFDIEKNKITDYIKPEGNNKKKGFAEGLFIPEKNSFLISQMHTNKIYEYSYPELKFIRSFDSGGNWPKYLIYSKILNIIAVSNWDSNIVSIINYETGKLIKKITTSKSPRGLGLWNEDKYLIIATFDGGELLKVNTQNWKIENRIYKNNAAMRHINIDNSDAYVSDMYHNLIYKVNLGDFKITKSFKVFDNPNTIDIFNNYLYISTRGPNNSETYLKRSPVNGKIIVYDLSNDIIAYIIDGGNQPTGLAVSNNGKYLCFSNFMDNNIEIYRLK